MGRGLLAGAMLLAVVPVAAKADIYLKRDADGVLHFTNVPAERGYRVIFRETAPVPSRRFIPRAGASPLATDPSRFDDIISEMAARYGVEKQLVRAVIKAESDFQPWAVSRKGAMGLMQLMPETAAQHRVRNIFDPRENIEGGVKHLRKLLVRYRGNVIKALAAYNAGEGAVDGFGGLPPIGETRDYVRRVLTFRREYLLGRR